ncbi:CCCH zinc finger dna binding protein [Rutstroemia sp. NJR-2017a BBW]|nr:CCCH zinc finger dna binding protein [Rutstroemia sp. NJR-2017a BBW]
MVLIDGDGMIFNQDLINQGVEGGKKAANVLRASILEQCHGTTDEIEIMAKVCANYAGLSKALKRDGGLESLESFKDFTLGFTQGKANFDFIDVGHGKERADSKIKGPPMVRELSVTGLPTLKFDDIFRSEKLMDRIADSATPNATHAPSTWAGVTSIPPPPGITSSPIAAKAIPITTKKPANVVNRPSWTPEPRGLDPPITVNREILEKIKRRTTNNKKLCNNHYLRGPCSKGSECCFEHDYKATDEDLKAIGYLARMNPCVNGQDCDQEDCIYGHHCPSVIIAAGSKEPTCMAFSCKFYPEDHPPGTIMKHAKKEREYERY